MKNLFVILVILLNITLLFSHSFSQQSPSKFGLGLCASGIKLIGDSIDHSNINYASALHLKYSFSKIITGEFSIGIGWVYPKNGTSTQNMNKLFRTYLYPWNLNLRYNLKPDHRLNPYIGLGLGLTHWNLRNISDGEEWFPVPESGFTVSGNQKNFTGVFSTGVEIFFSQNIGLDLGFRYLHLFDQTVDNIGTGDINDGLLEFRVGFDIYFGGYRDSDNDGIEDKFDAAPYRPEDFDGFEDDDGAPELDNDRDGIPDDTDLDPFLPEDLDGFLDRDGIPDPDNDYDGIPDEIDKCINEPEDFDNYEDTDGCPDPDNDEDGILDADDQCPNEPETYNNFQDTDGCPDVVSETIIKFEEQNRIILPGIRFSSGQAIIQQEAKNILNDVVLTLKNMQELRVEIRGYTDSIGSRQSNLILSQRRADAVKDYLVKKGIVFSRLTSRGFGEDDPVASNASVNGRAKNRRIEFIKLDK